MIEFIKLAHVSVSPAAIHEALVSWIRLGLVTGVTP